MVVQLYGVLMTQFTISTIRQRLFEAIPDGKSVSWAQLLEKSGEQRKQVESLAFGKPDSVSRSGNRFIARGKVAAEMPPRFGFRAFSDKEVRFTVQGNDKRLVITDIVGVKVQPPVGFKFSVKEVVVSTDEKGNFTLGTAVFGIALTVTLDADGNIVTWRFGK